MAFNQLPNELLQNIFEQIFPARWGRLSSNVMTRKDLALRLTCKKFNKIILHCAFAKYDLDLDHSEDEYPAPRQSFDTVCAMGAEMKVRFLVEKTRMNTERYSGLIHTLQHTGRVMCHLLGDSQVGPAHRERIWYNLCEAATSHCGPYNFVVTLFYDQGFFQEELGKYDNALPVAVYEGNLLLLSQLLEKGANANAKSPIFGTPLHVAASNNREAAAKLLLENGARVTDFDWKSQTVLHSAASKGHTGMTQLLLKQENIQVNARSRKFGRTPLCVASGEGHEAIVKLLLERTDIIPDSRDEYDIAPLDAATAGGHEAVMELLLARENVDPCSNRFSGPPLSTAAAMGNVAIAKLLMKKIGIRGNSFNRALHSAASSGHETSAVARLLLEGENANPNCKNDEGQSCLTVAVSNGSIEVVRVLLERENVDTNLKSHGGQTALIVAILLENAAVVKLLLGHQDVDPNLGQDGHSPLMLAVIKCNDLIVKLLLEREDVEVGFKYMDGQTPLHIAVNRGYEHVVRLLLERKNLDADTKDNHGRTPLVLAAAKGHVKIVKVLLARQEVNAGSQTCRGEDTVVVGGRRRSHGDCSTTPRER